MLQSSGSAALLSVVMEKVWQRDVQYPGLEPDARALPESANTGNRKSGQTLGIQNATAEIRAA